MTGGKTTLQLNGKLWMEQEGLKLIGPGRVELLQRIDASGSIRQSALQMNMSYRQAWQLVDQMNTQLASPVVLSQRGGKGGGNAELTEYGRLVISRFTIFYDKFHQFLAENQPDIGL